MHDPRIAELEAQVAELVHTLHTLRLRLDLAKEEGDRARQREVKLLKLLARAEVRADGDQS